MENHTIEKTVYIAELQNTHLVWYFTGVSHHMYKIAETYVLMYQLKLAIQSLKCREHENKNQRIQNSLNLYTVATLSWFVSVGTVAVPKRCIQYIQQTTGAFILPETIDICFY